MGAFPVTSATLIQKIKSLPPGADEAEWVRFWDAYSGAIRTFAARKGGEENADDIVMAVLGKLVDVLRSGQYSPEKGAFHSYLSVMVLNEVHMLRRRELARKVDRRISLDMPLTEERQDVDHGTLADLISVESIAPEVPVSRLPPAEGIDEDWRQSILASAVEHVLTKTALSQRDRDVYREYAQEGRPIDEVASKYRLSRNSVSQIKTRINRRIVAIGKELISRFKEL